MFSLMRKESRVLKIHAEWDDAVSVWVVTSDDVPGLVTEVATLDELNIKLRTLIPELLELNGLPDRDASVPLELLIQSEHRLALGC